MLGVARKRFLVPAATTVLSQIRAAVTGEGIRKAWYSDFDLGKKPGDWDCATCFHLNFSRRDSCQRCGNPRPGGGGAAFGGESRPWGSTDVKPGDWFCSSCNTHNFANRGTCFKCGSEKGETVTNTDGRPGWRQGDWICKSCSEHNFASRGECFKCSAPKEQAASY